MPEGITLSSEAEHSIWDKITRERARQDWRDMDLILLAKVVCKEADICGHQSTTQRSGVLIKKKRGTLVHNPFSAVVDTLERCQLADIRSMSLNQLFSDARTIDGLAKSELKPEPCSTIPELRG